MKSMIFMVLAIFNQVTPLLNILQLIVTTCLSLATCSHPNTHIEFNVIERKFIRKIKLQVPNEKVIKLALGEFHKTYNGFLVELTTSKVDTFHPDFYRNSGNLIYSFDENGDSIASFIKFPEILKAQERTINIEAFMESSFSDNFFTHSFPQEKKLKSLEFKDPYTVKSEIDLPISRHFNYEIKGFDKVISFDDLQNTDNANFPNSHYFMSIRDTEAQYYIQTWLIGDESKGLNRTSHLMIYDKVEEEWTETRNPMNILDIGMLAGVVNDTLYFYEGSLMNSDEKYIKRAILKPIED